LVAAPVFDFAVSASLARAQLGEWVKGVGVSIREALLSSDTGRLADADKADSDAVGTPR
jgi:hypothetical protein